jgi:hypothetical protein
MNNYILNGEIMSEILKARKAHLTALLDVIGIKSRKSTEIQKLTIKAITAEINLIEHRLKIRN